MSTISLPFEDQIRHFYLLDAVASETTIQTFISGASIGEVQIFGKDGLTATTAGDFYIAKKNYKGGISKSDFITPKDISYLAGKAPNDKVGKTQIFTLSSAPVAGKEYLLKGKIHYGNSEENFITFVVGEKAVTGDTQNTILARLAKQMADNLGRSVNTNSKASGLDTIISGTTAKKNKYFSFAVATNALTITEKDWILEDFRVGLMTHDQLMFNFEMVSPDDAENLKITKSGSNGTYASGKGYQIIELERYLVGHRAESSELLDSTLGFKRPYDTNITSDYYVLNLKYSDTSRDSEKKSNKMLTLVSTSAVELDKIGFAIESRMGGSEGDLWTELDPTGDGADNAA